MLLAGLAHADTYVYRLLVDTDRSAATGCGVPVHDAAMTGTFAGAERVVSVTVDRTAAGGTVTGVSVAPCVNGVLAPEQAVSAGGWPVGRGTGFGDADVIEAAVPTAMLGNGTQVRVAFTAAAAGGGSDVALSVDGASDGPPVLFQLPSMPVPALGPAGLALGAALVGAAALLVLRRRGRFGSVLPVAVAVACVAAATALALVIRTDGLVDDWGATAPVAIDPEGDSSAGDAAEDLVAGFLGADSANLYVRFDVVDVNVCSRKSDGQPVAGCCFADADCAPPATCGGGGVPNLCSLTIGWANLQWPPALSHTISAVNRTADVYGQVWIDGVTSLPGAAPGLTAQVGFGPEGSDPAASSAWTWVDAAFGQNAGNNDEFKASLLPEAVGTFDYVYRYSTTSGLAWLIADLNGPVAAGALPPNPGKMTVSPSGDTSAPAAPANLTVTRFTASAIDLGWDAVVGDATLWGYEVLRAAVPGGPYARIALVTGTTYSDTGVVEGGTYFYVVRSLDLSFNFSGYSNEVSAQAVTRTVTVVFNVTVPATTDGTGRSVFIAGSLDRLDGGLPPWSAAGAALTRVDATHWTITLTGDEGTQIEYKYTLGSFDFVEKDGGCGEISNRALTLTYGGTGTQTVNDTVLNWRNVAPCGN